MQYFNPNQNILLSNLTFKGLVFSVMTALHKIVYSTPCILLDGRKMLPC